MKNDLFEIKCGDCLELMQDIPDGAVDLVLTDLPYGITETEWDSCVDIEKLWSEWRRIVRPFGQVLLFGIQPFTSKLIHSNIKSFKYLWYWKKNTKTGGLIAYKQPMRCIEEIAVFIMGQSRSNRGMHISLRDYFWEELRASGLKRKDIDTILGNQMCSHYFTRGEQFEIPKKEQYEKIQNAAPGHFLRPYEKILLEWNGGRNNSGPTYNLLDVKECKPRPRKKCKSGLFRFRGTPKPSIRTGFPCHLLEYKTPNNLTRFHPTQKPVDLLEFLIRTHSNEGDTVLDCCMGSGSTGVAALNTGRRFIGYELDEKYFQIARKRIQESANLPLSTE